MPVGAPDSSFGIRARTDARARCLLSPGWNVREDRFLHARPLQAANTPCHPLQGHRNVRPSSLRIDMIMKASRGARLARIQCTASPRPAPPGSAERIHSNRRSSTWPGRGFLGASSWPGSTAPGPLSTAPTMIATRSSSHGNGREAEMTPVKGASRCPLPASAGCPAPHPRRRVVLVPPRRPSLTRFTQLWRGPSALSTRDFSRGQDCWARTVQLARTGYVALHVPQ